MTDITLANLVAIGGKFRGAYPPLPPGNSHRIASAYRFEAPTPMKQTYPPLTTTAYDAHLWADTKAEYSVRMAFRGGEPPFRVVKLRQPSWAQLGAGVDVQDFVRTETAIAGVYEFSLPEKYMAVGGQPDTEGVYDFAYLIIDQTGSVLSINWSCEVTNSGRIKYGDPVLGNDANPGTFELPLQTFPAIWNFTNADQFIWRLKPGTYNVSDGAGGNANFGAGKPRAVIGISDNASLYVLNMGTALMSGSASNIVMKNLRITGAPAAADSPRQLNFNSQASGAHLCNLEFDTRVGLTGNDNSAGVFFPDIGVTKSKGVSIVDCKLLSTSTAKMVVYFSVEDVIEENCTASGVVFPLVNGSLISHFKGRTVNCTQRFCNYSANSDNGIVWVSNQNPEDCENVELVCNTYTNIGAGNGYPVRFNGQVHSDPMLRPAGMLIQRCSISAGDTAPLNLEAYVGGQDVEYSGLLWSSSTASSLDTTGGVAIDPASIKVADINAISAPMVGTSAKLLSTLVT